MVFRASFIKCTDLFLECKLKFMPTLRFVKTVFGIVKCLVPCQVLSMCAHFFFSCSRIGIWKKKIFFACHSQVKDNDIDKACLQDRYLKQFSCAQFQDHLWFTDSHLEERLTHTFVSLNHMHIWEMILDQWFLCKIL